MIRRCSHGNKLIVVLPVRGYRGEPLSVAFGIHRNACVRARLLDFNAQNEAINEWKGGPTPTHSNNPQTREAGRDKSFRLFAFATARLRNTSLFVYL